jgi:hypothetical protein
MEQWWTKDWQGKIKEVGKHPSPLLLHNYSDTQ